MNRAGYDSRLTDEQIMEMDRKRIYFDKLAIALRADNRSNIDSLEYKFILVDKKAGYYDEQMTVNFEDGYSKTIDITGNSNLASTIAICRAAM